MHILLERNPIRFAPALFLLVHVACACGGKTSSPHNGTSTGTGSVAGESDEVGGNTGSATGGNANGGTSVTESTSNSGGSSSLGGAMGVGAAMASGGRAGVGGATAVDCSLVDCPRTNCVSNATHVTRPGECCPVCVGIDASCASAQCDVNLTCPQGFAVRREAGACCDSCYPLDGSSRPNCDAVACAQQPDCPLGYRHSPTHFRCCNDCEPDPNYCEEDSDCAAARGLAQCCSCPESISNRLYNEDLCYSMTDSPRSIPADCQPQVTCNSLCLCPAMPIPRCVDHSCDEVLLL